MFYLEFYQIKIMEIVEQSIVELRVHYTFRCLWVQATTHKSIDKMNEKQNQKQRFISPTVMQKRCSNEILA